MRISLFVVGRLKEKHFQAAESVYLKRIAHMARIEVREFQDEAALASALPQRSTLVLFDERGDNISSREFSSTVLERHAVSGGGAPLIFAIGGADGHTDALRSRATRALAFGKLTIAHRLVRLLVLEQIYRGLSIIAKMPYHRD